MEKEKMTVIDCPYCEGSEFGCCFCDHSGKVYKELIPNEILAE